ncbi:MAG: serine hydrolase, partial [Patescibacteria group bacterium]
MSEKAKSPDRYLKMPPLYKIFLVVLVVLLVGSNTFWFTYKKGVADPSSVLAKQYPYLSKRIFIEDQNDFLINFIPLRNAMREYVNEQDGNVGAYFEYLPSGTSIGVNDSMEVKIASLVKVPVVMAIMKDVEKGKLSLDQKVTIKKEDLNRSFGDLWKKGAGATISIQEAIDLALIKSDNTASNILARTISDTRDSVLDALDIPNHG